MFIFSPRKREQRRQVDEQYAKDMRKVELLYARTLVPRIAKEHQAEKLREIDTKLQSLE